MIIVIKKNLLILKETTGHMIFVERAGWILAMRFSLFTK